MTSEFPGGPGRFVKGALVVFASNRIPGPPKVIVFQYNSEQLTRSLERQSPSGNEDEELDEAGKRAELLRVIGPPVEDISLTVSLDAADQLEFPLRHPHTVTAGLHPVLATLELLLYPPSSLLFANFGLAAAGARSLVPMDVPMALLVWGAGRVVPILVRGLSVTEQAFDQLLNPIRAEVEMSLRVLSTSSTDPGTIAHNVALVHHTTKEAFSLVHLHQTTTAIAERDVGFTRDAFERVLGFG